jgi:hypothetical protein
MLLTHGVVSRAHIEQHATVFEFSGCGMTCQIFFDALRQPLGRVSFCGAGHPRTYQPRRARRLTMCAV